MNDCNIESEWLGHVQNGMSAMARADWPVAVRSFQVATQTQPQRLEGWVNLSTALLEQGQQRDALEAAREAGRIHLEHPAVLTLLGDALRQNGYQDDALQSYRAAAARSNHPLVLNKFGCALRYSNFKVEAAAVFKKALRSDANFVTARVNLTATYLMMNQWPEAKEQLALLEGKPIGKADSEQYRELVAAFQEYDRIAGFWREVHQLGIANAPVQRLIEASEPWLLEDSKLLAVLAEMIRSADSLDLLPAPETVELPEDWDRVEALFMIPYIETVDQYLSIDQKQESEDNLDDYGESLLYETGVRFSRVHRDFSSPLAAEFTLRAWHAKSVDGLTGFLPGHFKHLINHIGDDPGGDKSHQFAVIGTLKRFFAEYYQSLPEGIIRAVVGLYLIIELHPFSNGNGRIAMLWVNRELQSAGEMPALFTRQMGLRGELRQARFDVRSNPSDLTPLIQVIRRGQQYAVDFCRGLAEKRSL